MHHYLGELLLVEISALAVAGCLNCLGFWSLILVLVFELINFIRSRLELCFQRFYASSSVFKDFSN